MMMRKRFLTLLCCSLASLALAATACDDGEPNDNNGDATDTTGGDTTTTDTSTDTGTDTNTTTPDTSVDTTGDTNNPGDTTDSDTSDPGVVCAAAGAACDPTAAQPAAFRCVDDGAGNGTCFAACGADSSCAQGSICIDTMSGGVDDYCQPSDCAGFFESDCPGGEKCIPVGNGANFCFTNGAGAEDAACQAHTDCGADLLCVGGACFAPTCDPLDGTPACGTGEECSGFSVGDEVLPVGSCVTRCDPFSGTDTCAADGEWCFPNNSRDATGALLGTCTTDAGGTAATGATCDNMTPATTCGTPDDGFDPLICLGECEQMCDPADQTTCDQAADQGCFQVSLVDGEGNPIEVDWGLCNTNCTPSWDPADAGMGCEADQYCWPDFRTEGLAQCFASSTGTKTDGEACNPNAASEECVNGTLCLSTDQAGTMGECAYLCNPAAADGEPGTCAPGDNGQTRACLALSSGMTELAVGSCADTCNLADLANEGCTPASDGSPRACQVGGLFGLPNGIDLCAGVMDPPLTEGAACADADEFNFCKENGMCLDIGNGVECVELCSGARGQLGSAHPDCGGDVCQGLFQTMDFGVCQ